MTRKALQAVQAAQLLFDTGLLFEINRLVLHPYGLALSVGLDIEDHDLVVVPVRLNLSDNPEGIIFKYETFIEGQRKYHGYRRSWDVLQKESARRQTLGYIIQPCVNLDVTTE